jgi:hypothetical protein
LGILNFWKIKFELDFVLNCVVLGFFQFKKFVRVKGLHLMLAFGTDQFRASGQGKLSVEKLQASKLDRQATFGTEKNIDKIMQKINSRQTMNS